MLEKISVKKIENIIAAAAGNRRPKRKSALLTMSDIGELVDQLLEKGSEEHIPILAELEKMSQSELEELCAVMFYGRGHSEEESNSFAYCRRMAKGQNASYIATKKHLAKFLRNGLLKLGLV